MDTQPPFTKFGQDWDLIAYTGVLLWPKGLWQYRHEGLQTLVISEHKRPAMAMPYAILNPNTAEVFLIPDYWWTALSVDSHTQRVRMSVEIPLTPLVIPTDTLVDLAFTDQLIWVLGTLHEVIEETWEDQIAPLLRCSIPAQAPLKRLFV